MKPQQPISPDRCFQAGTGVGRPTGFTLIELLVAMVILVCIVLAVARIFQQASVAWQTGTRKAENIMAGRAVADFLAQQLSHAIPDTNGAPFSTSWPLSFMVLEEAAGGTGAVRAVTYSNARLAAGIVDEPTIAVCPEGSVGPWTLPRSVVVTVKMSNMVFQSSAFFSHRDRNRL